MSADADRIRLDKWLWAARFFKTRSLASQAIDLGRIRIEGERIKPAREARVGDLLDVQVGDPRCRADLELARVHHPILAGEGPSKPGRLVPVQMVDDVRVFGVRARSQSRRCWREATTTWSGVALSQPTTPA